MKTMKKTYMNPEMVIVKIVRPQIMAGSIKDDVTGTTFDPNGDPVDNPNDMDARGSNSFWDED